MGVIPKWLPPPEGYVKINVEAATSKTGGGGVVAVVCRSGIGEFMGASALTISDIGSAAALEALACREVLALAQDLNVQTVCIATDCLEVANNIQRPYFDEYGMIIQEIKETASLFRAASFRHENRVSNGEAHRLGRSCVDRENGRRVWFLQLLKVFVSLAL
jgi:ribonuclease HI